MISITELPQLHSDAASEQTQSAEPLRVCLVTLGEETFAIDLRQIREVFEPDSITSVPGMPAAVIGVTNLRGTILPLADVRAAVGVSSAIRPKYAVVVLHGTQQVGILVEAVPEIRTIQLDDPAPPSTPTAAEGRSMVYPGAVLDTAQLLASIEETVDDRSS
jgi:purine-binding chemotaxis protein CheW